MEGPNIRSSFIIHTDSNVTLILFKLHTHVSKANDLSFVIMSCHNVIFRHIQDTASVGQMKVHHTKLTLEGNFDTSTYKDIQCSQ